MIQVDSFVSLALAVASQRSVRQEQHAQSCLKKRSCGNSATPFKTNSGQPLNWSPEQAVRLDLTSINAKPSCKAGSKVIMSTRKIGFHTITRLSIHHTYLQEQHTQKYQLSLLRRRIHLRLARAKSLETLP